MYANHLDAALQTPEYPLKSTLGTASLVFFFGAGAQGPNGLVPPSIE